jgi:hypothetical protein
LKQTNRVVRRQDRDSRAQSDPFGLTRDGAKDHFGRRHRKIIPMMFAKAEIVDPDLIGQHTFGHHIPDHLILR